MRSRFLLAWLSVFAWIDCGGFLRGNVVAQAVPSDPRAKPEARALLTGLYRATQQYRIVFGQHYATLGGLGHVGSGPRYHTIYNGHIMGALNRLDPPSTAWPT